MPHMRVARPSDNLGEVVEMYQKGLGFEVLGSFADHEGFDGVMLGRPGSDYHLEFTQHKGHEAGKASTEENLLVFYLPDLREWTERCQRMLDAGFKPGTSYNPYWDRQGRTFEDPDGYRVVVQQSAWPG